MRSGWLFAVDDALRCVAPRQRCGDPASQPLGARREEGNVKSGADASSQLRAVDAAPDVLRKARKALRTAPTPTPPAYHREP